MSRYRALLTDTDRDHLTGDSDPDDQQVHQTVYRVRQRINEELPQDIEILKEHHPKLLDDLKEVIHEHESLQEPPQ